MDKLIQVHPLNTRTFVLNERGVNYTFEEGKDLNETFLPYEEVMGERLEYSGADYKNGFVFLGFAFFVLGILIISVKLNIITLGISALLIGLASTFIGKREHYRQFFWKIRLSDDRYLYLHQSIPNADEVDQFLEKLEQKRRRYLLREYAYLHPELSYSQQLQNLKWLKKMGVLNKKEFMSKMRILERYFPADDVFLDYFGEDEGSLN